MNNLFYRAILEWTIHVHSLVTERFVAKEISGYGDHIVYLACHINYAAKNVMIK